MKVDLLLWVLACVSMGLSAIGVGYSSPARPQGGYVFGIDFFKLAWLFVFLTFVL